MTKKRQTSPKARLARQVRKLVGLYAKWQGLEEASAAGDECAAAEAEFSHLADGLFEESGFDEALEEACGEGLPADAGFDPWRLKAALLSEASGSLLFVEDLRKLLRFDLFFVPVGGSLLEIGAFVDGDGVAGLAKSFRGSGLAADASNVLVVPLLLDQADACVIRPGQLRATLNLLMPVLADMDEEKPDVAALRTALGLPAEASLSQNPVAVGDRLILCARMAVGPDGEDQPWDSLVAEEIDYMEDLEETEAWTADWYSRTKGIAGDRVLVSLPCSLVRGLSTMSVNRIQRSLTLEALKLGVDVDRGFDEIHCGNGEGGCIFVEAVSAGRGLGPIDAPALAAMLDAEWFMDEMQSLAAEVIPHCDVRTMPFSGRRLN